MPDQSRIKPRRLSVAHSRWDVGLVVIGVIAAAASGVVAHRVVGPYGDGPFNVGLYRLEDPDTGVQMVYRDVRRSDGTVLRYLFNDHNRILKQIQIRKVIDGNVEVVGLHLDDRGLSGIDAQGQSVWRDGEGGSRAGFSLGGNGLIDAWEYRDAKGRLVRIEVSRRQDASVDRWEFYENDQLSRVEEDDNRDGKPDRWLTYEAGILVAEARDRDGDGRPDPIR